MAMAYGRFAVLGAALLAATPVWAQENVITSHGISTFGELQLPADFTHLPYVNPDAPKGGEISVWAFGGFDSMNPYSVKGRAAGLSSAPYESILVGTADEIGAAYCLLCNTLEYPEDRSWVIFNLRPEVTFSDGTLMTAEDVLFTYQTFLEKGLTDFRTVLATQVEDVEVLDPHRIKFTFKAGFPFRDLPADMGGLPVMSKAHYEANNLDLEESSMTPALGTGKYVPGRIDVGKSITWVRNPDYWGKDLPMNRGRGNFDTIRIEYYSDYDAAFEGFKAGNYTFRNEASSIKWATGFDFPEVAAGHIIKAELPNGSKASGQAFLFNLRRDKFQDPRVREAIGLMFNFEWSNATLFYDLYARINSVWENTWLEATGTPSPEETALLQPLVDEGLLPATILTEPVVMAPTSGERQLDRVNVERASELLSLAGWEVRPPPPSDPRVPVPIAIAMSLLVAVATIVLVLRSKSSQFRVLAGVSGLAISGLTFFYFGMPRPNPEDGMRRNAAGQVLSVEMLNDSPTFDRVMNPYIENLKAIGVDARMTRVDNAQMESRTRPPSYDFDLITGNARSSYISGSELKQFYGSETADVSAFNIMGLKNPAVDKLIDVVMASQSLDDLTVATQALDRVLRAERFWVPQWYKNTHTVAYYNMFEHPETLPPYALGELDFWWYNAEKAAALKAAGVLR